MVPASRGPFPSRTTGTGVRLIVARIGHIFFGTCCVQTLCHLLKETKEVFMIPRVEMLTLKPFILLEVTLHLTYWVTVITDITLWSHWSWSGHRAKHLLESSRWVHYYLYKKHHFPHSETESGRGSYLAQSNTASISDSLSTDLYLYLNTSCWDQIYPFFFSPSKLAYFSAEAMSFHIWTFGT